MLGDIVSLDATKLKSSLEDSNYLLLIISKYTSFLITHKASQQN